MSPSVMPAPKEVAVVDDGVEQLALAVLQRHDLLLDRPRGHQPVHGHRTRLPDPVGAVDGLRLGGRVPPGSQTKQ